LKGILWVAERTVLVRWRYDDQDGDDPLGFVGVADNSSSVYWRASGINVMRHFGLSYPRVAKRTAYIFRPRERFILPTAPPSHSLPSPVSEWADEMRWKFPGPVLAAMRQAQAEYEAAEAAKWADAKRAP
jgi:hypothetical protein